MKLKDKIKSYSFWVSLASAIILILKILGNRFGFAIDETMVSDLFTALCSILVLLGIIVPPSGASAQNNLSSKNTLINQTILEPAIEQNKKIDSEFNNEINEEKLDKKPSIEAIIEPNTTEIINQETIVQENEKTFNNNCLGIQEETIEDINSQEVSDNANSDNQLIKNTNKESLDLKQMFFKIKENFSDNLDSYIFELQEEIRKTREGM